MRLPWVLVAVLSVLTAALAATCTGLAVELANHHQAAAPPRPAVTVTAAATPKVITRVRTKRVTRTVPGPPSVPCFEESGHVAGLCQPSGAGTGPPVETTCTIVLRTEVPSSNDEFYAQAPDGSTLNLQVVP
jgi:hypothetical protein